MKGNHSRMCRSVLALVLVLCMTIGLLPAAAFAQPVKTIKYVSLGDSMTNGYGLTDYGNNGYKNYGAESYANQFATWLVENGYADNVEHFQYALAGMRAEDLHFILEFPIDDAEAIAVAEGPYDEEKWNATFPIGDYYTWDESTTGRFRHNCGGTNQAAKDYQGAVAEADIISVGTGNANFGVFLLGRVMDAIGFFESSAEDDWLSFERALNECDPLVRESILLLKVKLDELLTKELAASTDAETQKMLESMIESISYTVLSYLLHYAGALEAIVRLNPDAEIMLVGIMNTMYGLELTYPVDGGRATVAMKDLMNLLVEPVNDYIAALPTILQGIGNGAYENATFYFAEAPEVDCVVNTYAQTIRGENVIRDRFITQIVGNEGDGLIWGLMKGMVSSMMPGAELLTVNREEVEAYEKMTDVKRAAYAAQNGNKALSLSLYLAFEDAIVKSCSEAQLTTEGIVALSDVSAALFNGVAENFAANIGTNGAQKMDAAATVVAAASNGLVTKEQIFAMYGPDAEAVKMAFAYNAVAAQSGGALSAEDVAVLYQGGDAAIYEFIAQKSGGLLDAASVEAIYNSGQDRFGIITNVNSLKTAVVGVDTAIATIDNSIISNVNLLCTLLALPETMSAALQSDDMIFGLLHLFGRFLIGDGIGTHPSETGHGELARAVINSYSSGHTAEAETMENLWNLLQYVLKYLDENQETLLDDAYQYMVEQGYVAAVEEAIAELKAEVETRSQKYMDETVPALEEAIAELEADVEGQEAMLQTLKAELEAKKAELDAAGNATEETVAELERAIAELEASIAEVEKAQAALYEDLNELKASLKKVLEELNNLAEAVVALDNAVENVMDALKNVANVSVESLVDAVSSAIGVADAAVKLVEVVYDRVNALVAEVVAVAELAVEKAYDIADMVATDAGVNQNPVLQQAVKAGAENLLKKVETAAEAVTVTIAKRIQAAVEAIKQTYINATTFTYTPDADSLYVAIGDASAYGESYVELVAEELNVSVENLAEDKGSVETAFATVEKNADTIAKADLITVGFTSNSFVNEAINQAMGYGEAIGWAELVGAEAAGYVEKAVAQVVAELEKEVGAETAALLGAAIEAYAYSCAAYAVKMPALVDEIRSLNPDAAIVLVGMYNPLENMELDMNGTRIQIGAYMDYLTAAAGVHGLGYAMLSSKGVFVAASQVETVYESEKEAAEMGIEGMISEYLRNWGEDFLPSEAGHQYIAEQIIGAIRKDAVLGDANGDGAVNAKDAMLVLQYYTKKITADKLDASVCDVDGNNTVNAKDAMLILQFYTKKITVFPVEAK